MNEPWKSDRSMVPEKSANKTGQPAAEPREGRDLAEGNLRQQNTYRTQSRGSVPSALERVRQAARKNKETRFTALFHYVYDLETLKWAFFQLKKRGGPGRGWREVAALLRGPREQTPGPLREAAARSVSGKAGA